MAKSRVLIFAVIGHNTINISEIFQAFTVSRSHYKQLSSLDTLSETLLIFNNMMKENSPRKTYNGGPGNATPNACSFENRDVSTKDYAHVMLIMTNLY